MSRPSFPLKGRYFFHFLTYLNASGDYSLHPYSEKKINLSSKTFERKWRWVPSNLSHLLTTPCNIKRNFQLQNYFCPWTQKHYQRQEKENLAALYLWSRKFWHGYESMEQNDRDQGEIFHQYFIRQELELNTQSGQIWKTQRQFQMNQGDSFPFKATKLSQRRSPFLQV